MSSTTLPNAADTAPPPPADHIVGLPLGRNIFLIETRVAGIAEGIRLARQFRKIAAHAPFDGLAKGMGYQSVAVRAGSAVR
jgi:hypothetical protein